MYHRLKKIFVNDLKYSLPRFIYVFTLLHIFKNENNFFSVDWHKNLLKIFFTISISYRITQINNRLYKKIFTKNDNKLVYRLYLTINSNLFPNSLNYYNKIQNNKKQLLFINHLIDLMIFTKIKLFGILI